MKFTKWLRSFVSVVAILALSSVAAAANSNNVYERIVGPTLTTVFDGSAKKIKVTTLAGPIELKVTLQFSEDSHKILANPRRSKTILVNRGAGGPIKVEAKSYIPEPPIQAAPGCPDNEPICASPKRVPSAPPTNIRVEVDQITCNNPDACTGGTIDAEVGSF